MSVAKSHLRKKFLIAHWFECLPVPPAELGSCIRSSYEVRFLTPGCQEKAHVPKVTCLWPACELSFPQSWQKGYQVKGKASRCAQCLSPSESACSGCSCVWGAGPGSGTQRQMRPGWLSSMRINVLRSSPRVEFSTLEKCKLQALPTPV